MKKIIRVFVTFLFIAALSCENNQEPSELLQDNLEGVPAKGSNCYSEVQVNIADCGVYEIYSSKDLSNIVYRVDGTDTKIEPLSGHNYTLEVENVSDIWVKSGCNHSDDGAGYGEHFAVDDSELCEVELCDLPCIIDFDCPNTTVCAEGGFCAAVIGGRIFVDRDADGVFSAGDEGIFAGIFLQALAPEGWTDIAFDSTDPSGFYSHGAVNSTFDYRIRVIQPPGEAPFTYTTQDVGADDTIDSDVDASGISPSFSPCPDELLTHFWAGVLPDE